MKPKSSCNIHDCSEISKDHTIDRLPQYEPMGTKTDFGGGIRPYARCQGALTVSGSRAVVRDMLCTVIHYCLKACAMNIYLYAFADVHDTVLYDTVL